MPGKTSSSACALLAGWFRFFAVSFEFHAYVCGCIWDAASARSAIFTETFTVGFVPSIYSEHETNEHRSNGEATCANEQIASNAVRLARDKRASLLLNKRRFDVVHAPRTTMWLAHLLRRVFILGTLLIRVINSDECDSRCRESRETVEI